MFTIISCSLVLTFFKFFSTERLLAAWIYEPGYMSRSSLSGQDGFKLTKFFFLCLLVYRPRRSRGPWTREKWTTPISSHLDRTNLVNKGFIIWFSGKFFLRDTAGSPERTRWLHLARSGGQSQRAIWVILPAHGACYVIKLYYSLVVTFSMPSPLFFLFIATD